MVIQGQACHNPPSWKLEAQDNAAKRAMLEWDGEDKMPGDLRDLLYRDWDNLEVLRANPELALRVGGFIRDGYLPAPLVTSAARRHWWVDGRALLGLDPRRWYPITLEARLVRELVARFVEAGVNACP